jgi:hypothetical protein
MDRRRFFGNIIKTVAGVSLGRNISAGVTRDVPSLTSYHHVDVQRDLAAIMARELQKEIDTEMICKIQNIVSKHGHSI